MKNYNPYYAVIFNSTLTNNVEGYQEMAVKMEALARKQKGFIDYDSARDSVGITISYWETLDDVKNWKQQSDHLQAQSQGKTTWYNWYKVRICKVEREYEFNR